MFLFLFVWGACRSGRHRAVATRFRQGGELRQAAPSLAREMKYNQKQNGFFVSY